MIILVFGVFVFGGQLQSSAPLDFLATSLAEAGSDKDKDKD